MTGKHWLPAASYPLYKVRIHSSVMIIRPALFACALLFAPWAFSADISGLWKHTKNLAWIEIRLQEGVGTVERNDKFPDRVGRKILQDLQADKSKQGLWHGLIYAEKLGEYKNVEISLPEADRMLLKGKVGFMSRTVEWVRVDKIPTR
ncbi:MAG: hypothetical protein ACI9NT_002428 [Bacteroidia bacterium]|jgi:uncharacterized protein (DUF2147 family)